MINSLKRSQQCRQVGQVALNIAVSGTAVTPAASGPDAFFVQSVTDGGSGLYTITFKEASKINLHVQGLVSLTDQAIGRVTAVTTSSVTVQFDDPATGLAKDADFNLSVLFADQLSYYF